MADNLRKAKDFETQFLSWFSSTSGYKDKIDDSRQRCRMILKDAKERTDRNLSALSSTKSTEVVDKAKEAAIIEYHKDRKTLGYSAISTQNPEMNKWALWLTGVVHYRMEAINCFPFFTWHESSLKAGFTDGMEAVFAYWDKQSWTDTKTTYRDELTGTEIPEAEYKRRKLIYPDMKVADPMLPGFDLLCTKTTTTEEVVCRDTWWLRQLLPGENVLWDFKAPYMNVNSGQACLIKLPFTVDEIMAKVDSGVFDKIKREEVERYRTLQGSTGQAADKTASAPIHNAEFGDRNTIEVWIYWEKVKFRWMVSFSIEGKKELTKASKPSDDIFFNGRRVNMLPVVIGYMDKYLHENMGRSLPQVIAPIEDQYIDHINNANDIAKNIARGGRIRITPGTDIDIDQVMNAGAFKADPGDVEFIQYNPGIMEGMRLSDMHSAAINALAPVGISASNLSPKGTTKTLGQSQMVQGATDTKRFVQLMVRNQTFLKPLMWIIAQLEFAYETDEKALAIAASQVPGFQLPMTMDSKGQAVVDISSFDFDVEVQINAGLGEMADILKFNNLSQFTEYCKQLGLILDPMIIGQLAASLTGYSIDRFNPQPPPSNEPPPRLDSKLSVTATWADLPDDVKVQLIKTWITGKVATDTKVDARLNELIHNSGERDMASQQAPDMTQGDAAIGMSEGGMQS